MNLQAYEYFIKGLTKINLIYKPNSDFLFEFKSWKQTHLNSKFDQNLQGFKPMQNLNWIPFENLIRKWKKQTVHMGSQPTAAAAQVGLV
jgi:hypothetical protein